MTTSLRLAAIATALHVVASLSIWAITGETSGPAYRVVLVAWGVALIAIGARDWRRS